MLLSSRPASLATRLVVGIGVVVLAPEGVASWGSTPRMTDDARLRRIQGQAPELPAGLDLAQGLITDKLVGQAKVLTGYFAGRDVELCSYLFRSIPIGFIAMPRSWDFRRVPPLVSEYGDLVPEQFRATTP